ncbi:MAG: hypothetical protein AMS22_03145 [Thiotrichales bacterium SG8_50]|nr:MAG: hypothetical protein AMS22_03145 [Thiotrichales bacterium SG8_50]
MKISFVSANLEKMPNAVTPLGLLYIVANTPDHHKKEFIDLCFEPDPGAALSERLAAFRPDLVAISMRNIQNNDYADVSDNLDYYEDLIEQARSSSSAPIVLGGAGFSVMPAELMRRLKPDYGIAGEGERAFRQLVGVIEDGGEGLYSVSALHYWDGDTLVINPRRDGFLDLSKLSSPDRTLLHIGYFDEFGIDSVQTKRGCSLHCDYCSYPLIEGRKIRLRDPQSVVDEMFAALEAHPSLSHMFIVDSVFNLPMRHAKDVCRELIDRDWSVPWTCYANPLGFDEEFAELASRAGCAGMEVGSDAGSDVVLRKLKKGFTVDHIYRLRDICAAAGIPDCHTFIVGTTGETIDDVRHTVEFIADLDPHSAIINIWFDDYEALDPGLAQERRQLRADIEALLGQHRHDFPNWSIPALGVNFDEKMFAALRRAGFRGPLWQHLRRGHRSGPRSAAEQVP